MRKFKRLFSNLKDPRASNAQHDLLEIVFIALAATLCDAKHCTEMVQFGHSKEAVLRQLLRLEHGIPSHDTFSTVLRVLDPHAIEAALGKFTKAFNRRLGKPRTIAIDGKALRGAYRRGERFTPLHMVNVWAGEARMALAQRKAPNRNEIVAAHEVLALLDLDGAIVTADALHCTAAMAQAILDRKGHYVLALKKNRARLFTATEARLKAVRGASRARQPSALAHGRRERRSAVVMPAPDMAEQYRFPGLKAVGRIDSWPRADAAPAKHKVRYFPAVAETLGNPAAQDRAWALEHRKQSPLDIRRGLRRRPLPLPHGPRAGEPRIGRDGNDVVWAVAGSMLEAASAAMKPSRWRRGVWIIMFPRADVANPVDRTCLLDRCRVSYLPSRASFEGPRQSSQRRAPDL
jgi:predicted transposase YbfD/YdcC